MSEPLEGNPAVDAQMKEELEEEQVEMEEESGDDAFDLDRDNSL